jgi:hypothetical protein
LFLELRPSEDDPLGPQAPSDAFYAAIQKRDDPALAAEPVIIGGGRRGVVAAACYVPAPSG